MSDEAAQQPMVTDKQQTEVVNSDIPSSSHMDISMAFQEVISKDPPKYVELCKVVNKLYEDISNSVSQEEFKSILRGVSFLSKKNLTNLLSILKSQLYNHMNENFEEIIKEENLSELFSKQKSLNEEVAKKYLTDDESLELYELEESLSQLDVQIAKLEQSNEILFNQGKFNKLRYDSITERIVKILNECKTKFENGQEVIEMIQKELSAFYNK